jgi:hypothetical protein
MGRRFVCERGRGPCGWWVGPMERAVTALDRLSLPQTKPSAWPPASQWPGPVPTRWGWRGHPRGGRSRPAAASAARRRSCAHALRHTTHNHSFRFGRRGGIGLGPARHHTLAMPGCACVRRRGQAVHAGLLGTAARCRKKNERHSNVRAHAKKKNERLRLLIRRHGRRSGTTTAAPAPTIGCGQPLPTGRAIERARVQGPPPHRPSHFSLSLTSTPIRAAGFWSGQPAASTSASRPSSSRTTAVLPDTRRTSAFSQARSPPSPGGAGTQTSEPVVRTASVDARGAPPPFASPAAMSAAAARPPPPSVTGVCVCGGGARRALCLSLCVSFCRAARGAPTAKNWCERKSGAGAAKASTHSPFLEAAVRAERRPDTHTNPPPCAHPRPRLAAAPARGPPPPPTTLPASPTYSSQSGTWPPTGMWTWRPSWRNTW